MKAKVSQDDCISCGLCIDMCPEVFQYNEDSKSQAIEGDIPEECQDSAKEACESCPTSAIIIEENTFENPQEQANEASENL